MNKSLRALDIRKASRKILNGSDWLENYTQSEKAGTFVNENVRKFKPELLVEWKIKLPLVCCGHVVGKTVALGTRMTKLNFTKKGKYIFCYFLY